MKTTIKTIFNIILLLFSLDNVYTREAEQDGIVKTHKTENHNENKN